METTYRLITHSHDYKRAHSFLDNDEWDRGKNKKLSFPTIIAERMGEVVGVLSTRKSSMTVMTGSVSARSAFILIKMIEVYEYILRQAGVIIYLIAVTNKNKKFIDQITRIIGNPFHVDEDNTWFRRRI